MDQTYLTNSWGNLKVYLMETGIKRLLPIALGAALSTLAALLAAHQGMLESWGITFGTWPLNWGNQPPSGPVLVFELDTISKTALVALTALVSAFVTALVHAALPKEPMGSADPALPAK